MIRIQRLRQFHSKLSNDLNQAMHKLGITTPTEIQAKVIPKLFQVQNTIITAETGSGKTFAYLLPAIDRLHKFQTDAKSPKVLIIVPSRHLQIQLTMLLGQLSSKMETPFSFSTIPPPEGIPASQLKPVDIGVASIGCLTSKHFKSQDLIELLFSTKIVMLDEVDELLKDKVGRKFLDRVLTALNYKKTKTNRKPPKFVFCAATLPPKKAKNDKTPRNVILKAFKAVETISSDNTHSTPNGLIESFIRLNEEEKLDRLKLLLADTKSLEQTLVFCNTPDKAQQVHTELVKEFPDAQLELIHGDVPVEDRTKTILQLSTNESKIPHIIVSTDVISRGVDFKHVKTIIHYDFPLFAKNYIHRVGRTCRGDNQIGTSFSTPENESLCSLIEAASLGKHNDNERLKSHEEYFGEATGTKYPLTGLFTKKVI